MLSPRKKFVDTRMNQAVTFKYPVTNLNTVSAKEVLLSAAAKMSIVMVLLINMPSVPAS